MRDALPQLVSEDPATGMLSVDYCGLAAVLLSATNELAKRQEELRGELRAQQRASATSRS